MKVKEILKITKGKLLSGSSDIDICTTKISTDSRVLKKGEFFAALSGERFDGNDYVKDALKKGAAGALVTKDPLVVKPCAKVIIKVADALKSLQDIASRHRMRFDIPVIGITGSNGKTTTKEMIWSVLSAKYNVLKNEGTKNNHLGVPQTLLKLESAHDMCILEMGMNHKGEIRSLSRMSKPTVAVITNIGASHLEFLRDLKSVFEAKKEILESLPKGSAAILNGDDPFLSGIKSGRLDISRFGFKDSNDFRATNISARKDRVTFTLNDKKKYELNLLGLHNIYNALAAIAVGTRFGVKDSSVRTALLNYRPAHMRLNLKMINGVSIIDDSYNSNPLSMECALEVLNAYPARSKWIVSGDMLELGRAGRRFHALLGYAVARSNARGLLTLGELSKITLSQARRCGMDNLWHCSTHNEAAGILKKVLKKGDVVLVKGSRNMKMEEVIEGLKGRG